MSKQSKRYRKNLEKINLDKTYSIEEALTALKDCKKVKFDESVEVSIKLGVDPRKSDQQVRSTVTLPNGTGKDMKIVVLAKGDKVKEALDAGAMEAGDNELVDRIKNGWTDFDAMIATPDMMREVGRLGKILGPRGLMPTPKAGTVTNDVANAVEELKKGKVEFKVDKSALINNVVGKLSFEAKALKENISALLSALTKMKPASSKGQFMQSLYISSTMGPGLKVDVNSAI